MVVIKAMSPYRAFCLISDSVASGEGEANRTDDLG